MRYGRLFLFILIFFSFSMLSAQPRPYPHGNRDRLSGEFIILGVKVDNSSENEVSVSVYFSDPVDSNSINNRYIFINDKPLPPSTEILFNKNRRMIRFSLPHPGSDGGPAGAPAEGRSGDLTGGGPAPAEGRQGNLGEGFAEGPTGAPEEGRQGNGKNFSLKILRAVSFDGRPLKPVYLENLSAGSFYKITREERPWQKSLL